MTHKKHFEHKDVWRTPPRVLDCITEVIDLDPCASSESEVDEVSSIGLRNYRRMAHIQWKTDGQRRL